MTIVRIREHAHDRSIHCCITAINLQDDALSIILTLGKLAL